MEMMKSLGIKPYLFDFMERNATEEERAAGYDIADYLLQKETNRTVLDKMIATNPCIKHLIDEFDLKLITEDSAPIQSVNKQVFKRRLR